MSSTSSCPLCGSAASKDIFRAFRPGTADPTGKHTEDLFGRAGRIVRCKRCELVRQLNPRTAPYEEAEDPDYLTEEPGIRRTFGAVLDRVSAQRPPPGHLLDIGCGPGLMLEEATSRGWQAMGIEPSRWGATEGRRRGLEVTHGTLESFAAPESSFDVIVALDVIEHVPDPPAFAARISALLRPGGVVFIATPNVSSLVARTLRRWWWSIIPNHLWFFSPSTLGVLLAKAGLEPIETSTHPKTFSLTYYAARFGGYSATLGRITQSAANRLGGTARLVTPDFRDRTAMIARKPS